MSWYWPDHNPKEDNRWLIIRDTTTNPDNKDLSSIFSWCAFHSLTTSWWIFLVSVFCQFPCAASFILPKNFHLDGALSPAGCTTVILDSLCCICIVDCTYICICPLLLSLVSIVSIYVLAAKLFWPDVFVHICVYICIWISVILYSYLYLYLPSSFISTEHCLHQVGQWKIFGRQLRRGNWGRRMPSRASATLQQLSAKTNSWHDKYCWSTRHTCEQKQEYSSNKLCEKHAEFSVLLKTMTKQADLSN